MGDHFPRTPVHSFGEALRAPIDHVPVSPPPRRRRGRRFWLAFAALCLPVAIYAGLFLALAWSSR
jgi:hypothetical protein